MSEIETNSEQNKKRLASAPLTVLVAPFAFVGSLTLGIVLLSILLVLMALGTFIESEYGSAVAQFIIYDNPCFSFLIAFFTLNIAVSIILRFPWGHRRIPFLVAHGGILLLVVGCYQTWKHGEEAQITLPEGTVGRVAIKQDRQQFELKHIAHSFSDDPKPLHSPFRPGPFSFCLREKENKYILLEEPKKYKTIIRLAMHFALPSTAEIVAASKMSRNSDIKIKLLDYYAHSALEPVPPFDVNILWNKTIQVFTEVGDTKEVPRNWEMIRLSEQQSIAGMADMRGSYATMSQGERVSYSLAASQEELTAFQKSRPKGGDHAGLWGEIVLYYGGEHYHVNVDQLITLTEDQRFPVENSGLTIGNVRFSDRGLVVRFSLYTQSGERETMALLPDNPEMNVQARRLGVFGSYWVDPQRIMQKSIVHAEHPVLQRLMVQRLDFMQGPDKKLYYRLWSGQKIVADGVTPDRTPTKKPQFTIAAQTPDEVEIVLERFVPQDVPGHRVVPKPVTKSQLKEQRVKLRVTFEGKEDTFWIRAAVPTVVPLPPDQDQIRYIYGRDQTLSVELNFEAIDLGFGILLKNFEKRTEPGTRMPSHFSSLIDYVEAKDRTVNKVDMADRNTWFSRQLQDYRFLQDGENVLISMNRPGFFSGTGRGYRIYQSSYLGPYFPDQPQFRELYDGTIFPWETRPRESISMSTFSINGDPGRGLKYFGCFLIVLGTILFIWRKRW